MPDAAALYDKLMKLLVKFADHGVIHGDFNEFNIMLGKLSFVIIKVVELNLSYLYYNFLTLENVSFILDRETADPIIIDFPQMVSTLHQDAAEFFNRDVKCLQDFFRRR